jgi:membrane protein YdbS with pleckstrin-like domain
MKTTANIVTSPSQIQNFGWLALTIVSLFIHPIIAGLGAFLLTWSVLDVMTWQYQFHKDYIIEKRGILGVTEEMVNYFRIKSIKIGRPLWMRFFGLSVVYITTSEAYKPEIKLYAVYDSHMLVDFLSKKTKLKRKENGIRDMDIFYS